MKLGGMRQLMYAICLALVFLTSAVLPLALYEYFGISTPEILGTPHSYLWVAYLAPMELYPGAFPMLSSVDPLVTLIPTFALLLGFWSLIFYGVLVAIGRIRRPPHSSRQTS